MRNNNLLKATIAVALSAIVGGNAQAVFFNVNQTGTTLTTGKASLYDADTGTWSATANNCPDGQSNYLTISAPADSALFSSLNGPSGVDRTFCLASAATVIPVPNNYDPTLQFATPEVNGGVKYALQMFDGTTSPTLPTSTTVTTGYYAAAVYDTANQVASVGVRARFELSDGVFSGTPRLSVSNPQYGEFISSGTGLKGGDGQKYVEFDIVPVSSGTKVPLPLNADPTFSDWILLLYKVKNVVALAEETKADGSNALKMTFSATTSESAGKNPVFSTSTASIARSQSAIATEIVEETQGSAYVSVEEGLKLFTIDPAFSTTIGDCAKNAVTAGTGTGVSVSDTAVQIGCVKFSIKTGAVGPDGVTPFNLQSTSAGALDDSGTLNITANGQFAASLAAPGAVTFGDVSVLATDESTATFTLKASDIAAMTDDTSAYCSITGTEKVCKVPIKVKVDGTKEINISESKPTAELTLAFKDTSFSGAALSAPSDAHPNAELRRITQDGKTCTVWNVPSADLQDKINIRLTNNSKAVGKLYAKMWKMDGTVAAENVTLTEDFGVKQTLYFDSKSLAAAGLSWTGRAVIEIRSTVSDMEVLAMLRNKNPNAPLSNISLGAHGNSCNTVLTNHGPGF